MFVQSEQRWVETRPGGARGEPGKVGLVYMLGVILWMGLGSVSLWMGWGCEVREPGQVGVATIEPRHLGD